MYFKMKRGRNIFRNIYCIYKKLAILIVPWEETWVCKRVGKEISCMIKAAS